MRLQRKTAIVALAAVLTSTAYAQLPITPEGAAPENPRNELGGSATIDVITLEGNTLGVPLRHGGVLYNSERVDFGGKTLKRGEDYQIDYVSGVVYLMRAVRNGDVLRVAYRWDEAKEKQAATRNSFAGIAPFSFNILPGQRLMLGFGVTERQADGNLVQSNVFGWQNAFQFGGTGSAKGLLLFGDRQKVRSESNYEYQAAPGETPTGKSHFYMQNLKMGLGGGEVEVNYQDISKNFAGFAAAADAGYTQEVLGQLQKERGLKRFGFSVKDVGGPDLKLRSGFRSIKDGRDEIEWKSLGFSSGGFAIDWESQAVGERFSRFGDLAEKDREQLRKEAGLERESLAASFNQKSLKMTLNMRSVTDPNSADIERRELVIDTGGIKFEMGDQKVDRDFRRMGSLLGNEQAMWGRELGMQRQWMKLQANVYGLGMPIAFNQSTLRNEEGDSYDALDWKVNGRGWSLEQAVRGADPNFSQFGAMHDPERNEHINAIGRMYDPKGIPFRGEEVQWFQRSAGVQRRMTRFTAQPFKEWNVRMDRLELKGQEDDAFVDNLVIENKQLKLQYRRQDLGEHFNELSNLMEMERWRLGTISGLERTDFNLSYAFNPNRSFLYSRMVADSPEGGASRHQFAYKDPRLEVSVNAREVDPGFSGVSQLVDPEKDFLATLRGFKERDIKAIWQISSNLKFDLFMLDSHSATLDQHRTHHAATLAWQPDKHTSVFIGHLKQESSDPLSVLFAHTVDQIRIARSFQGFGTVRYALERKQYLGTEAQQFGSERQFIGYEAQLNPKTKFIAESTRTRWDDGGKEDILTNTVSTELNKNLGVSVSQVNIDRDGDERDEKKRGYGLWWNIGNGIRLVYGFAQHAAGEGVDTRNQNVQLTGGQIGNVQISNGSYVENQWEGGRTQALGNIGFQTVKPMSFLGLTNFKIAASLDTAADRSVWLKENQTFSVSGNLGANFLGFDFRSQMGPNGKRGFDRSFFFTTDQDEKKKLRLNLKYKQRSLPSGEDIHIRDYSIIAKPFKGFELSHSLLTHPEVARGDVILGSITTARRVNRWRLDWTMNDDTVIGGQWEEFVDAGRPLTRIGGMNVALFKKSGSPVLLYYGVEQSDPTAGRTTQHRYHLRFDQRPGPNQQFSLFIGNVSYQHNLPQDKRRNNLTVQLDFQLKF